jgi:hypothetical protein
VNQYSRGVSLALVASVAWIFAGALRDAGSPGARTEDRLVLQNAGATDAAMLAVHASDSGDSCPDDVALSGGGLHVIDNVEPPASCQVAVFSRNHKLLEVTPGWTTGPDTVVVQLSGNRRKVEVNLYVVSSDNSRNASARSDLNRARTAYKRNRVGLTFTESKFTPAGSLTQAQVAIIGDYCDAVDGLKQSSLYDPVRVNVFFVESIGGGDGWLRGVNCFPTASGNTTSTPNVIYISLSERSPNTLAHELGHALGLQLATGHTGSGDEAMIEGFKKVNIMWKGLESDEATAQKHFSLGQAYRMNADNSSWVNLTNGGVTPGGLPKRQCHPSSPADNVPCPPLAFDVPAKQ